MKDKTFEEKLEREIGIDMKKIGDFITATRSGTHETIQGEIVEIYKDVVWGYFLAVVKTIKGGERLITTETDTII